MITIRDTRIDIFHLIEKANGIKYLYAWLDRHPDVCAVAVKKVPFLTMHILKYSKTCYIVIIHFGGENMENLSSLGIFFGGLGFLLLSFGLFWWVSLYEKYNKSKQKEEK